MNNKILKDFFKTDQVPGAAQEEKKYPKLEFQGRL